MSETTKHAANLLRGYLGSTPAFRENEQLTAAALRIIDLGEALARRRRRLVFRHLGSDDRGRDLFELGWEGEPLRRVTTTLRGVWWAWAAIDDAGRHDVLRAADFAAPEASEPEGSARKAIRITAARWLKRELPELGAALAAITIDAGKIRYEPAVSALRIVTR